MISTGHNRFFAAVFAEEKAPSFSKEAGSFLCRRSLAWGA
jgi:hypothetical protein